MLNNLREKILLFSKYLEKYTKIGHADFLSSGFWLSLFQGLSILLGIVTSILFARFSDKITFGYYQFAFAVFGTVSLLSLPGINTAVIKSLVLGKSGSLFYGFKVRLKYSLLGGLALFVVAGYFYFIKQDILLTKVFLLLGCFFPLDYPFSIFYSYFTAHKQYKQWAVWQSVARVLGAGGVLFGIFYFNNIFWILFLYVLSTAIFHLTLYTYFRQKEIIGEVESSLESYGKNLTLSNFLPQVLNNFDKMVLPMFLGVEALAIYGIAIKIPDTIKGFFNSFDNVFIPKLVGKNSSLVANKIRNVWIFIGFLGLLAVVILCLPFAIRFMFGPAYEAAILPAQIYTIAILPFFVRRVANNWMQANGESKSYFINQTVWILTTCVAIVLFLLVQKSIISVVLAKILAAVVAAANGFYLMHKDKGENI